MFNKMSFDSLVSAAYSVGAIASLVCGILAAV